MLPFVAEIVKTGLLRVKTQNRNRAPKMISIARYGDARYVTFDAIFSRDRSLIVMSSA